MLFPQERKSTGGIVTQEPVLWINWEQETPNIKGKEPPASQKTGKLTKYRNAGKIRGWGFLLMLHGFLTSIKAGGKVKGKEHPTSKTQGKYVLLMLSCCSLSSGQPLYSLYAYTFSCVAAWWGPVAGALPWDGNNHSRQWNHPAHFPSL